MLKIDGSLGEGGGQILRTSLALSLRTKTPFRIENIRAARAKPGLMRQHLTAVKAATEVGNAKVHGAELGSMALEFHPGEVVPGPFHFSVGSAGSVTLVLQTVLPVLLASPTASSLVLEGGTHNPLAPTFEHLTRAFFPLVRRTGRQISAKLERPGFYPAGGGRFTVELGAGAVIGAPALHLLERGEVRRREATAMFSALPFDIASRELETIRKRLGWEAQWCRPLQVASAGPGNVVQLEIESEHVTEVFSVCGEKGSPAEEVALAAANEAAAYLEANVPVGPHLADQLLLLLALVGRGSFRTMAPTPHTTTQAEIISRFLSLTIRREQLDDKRWHVEVSP